MSSIEFFFDTDAERYYQANDYGKTTGTFLQREGAGQVVVDIELHQFLCAPVIVESIWNAKSHGCSIPRNAKFQCVLYTSTDTQSKMGPHEKTAEGLNQFVPFSTAGGETGLWFHHKHVRTSLSPSEDALILAIQPSLYSGSLKPRVAQGVLHPKRFVGEPRKQYSVKLLDAHTQRLGVLFFSMEVEPDGSAPRGPISLPHRSSRSPVVDRKSRDRPLVKERSRTKDPVVEPRSRSPLRHTKLSASRPRQEVGNRPSLHQHRCESTTHTPMGLSPARRDEARPSHYVRVGLIVERVHVSKAAGFLPLGEDYQLQIRYNSSICSTPLSKCRDPTVVHFNNYTQEFMMPSSAAAEEGHSSRIASSASLQFALWKGNTQVAGFRVNPSKFRVRSGEEKAYSIPFHYRPTDQVSSLDVRVYCHETPHQAFKNVSGSPQPWSRYDSTAQKHYQDHVPHSRSMDVERYEKEPLREDTCGAPERRTLREEPPHAHHDAVPWTVPTGLAYTPLRPSTWTSPTPGSSPALPPQECAWLTRGTPQRQTNSPEEAWRRGGRVATGRRLFSEERRCLPAAAQETNRGRGQQEASERDIPPSPSAKKSCTSSFSRGNRVHSVEHHWPEGNSRGRCTEANELEREWQRWSQGATARHTSQTREQSHPRRCSAHANTTPNTWNDSLRPCTPLPTKSLAAVLLGEKH